MTEDVSQRFESFDQWSTLDAITAMYEGQLFAIAAIKPALDTIAKAGEAAAQNLGRTGRLVYVGAGTSGRLAVQDGAELGPTFNWPQDRIVFAMAGGMAALTVSAEGAEDVGHEGENYMREVNITSEDVVIGVAASGKTPFTLGALQQAKAMGALTIGICNNPDTPILQTVDYAILAETGSEIVAGSTRMKAGTAQKAILNMLSTAIMTRLDRVYKGYMVDMVASNKKLERRAVNMVCDITKCSREIAVTSLAKSGQNIKLAVLIAMGETPDASRALLDKENGNLRQALESQSNS